VLAPGRNRRVSPHISGDQMQRVEEPLVKKLSPFERSLVHEFVEDYVDGLRLRRHDRIQAG
jgi:hypothetical protein